MVAKVSAVYVGFIGAARHARLRGEHTARAGKELLPTTGTGHNTCKNGTRRQLQLNVWVGPRHGLWCFVIAFMGFFAICWLSDIRQEDLLKKMYAQQRVPQNELCAASHECRFRSFVPLNHLYQHQHPPGLHSPHDLFSDLVFFNDLQVTARLGCPQASGEVMLG